jgi:hypothetical protein
MTEYEMIYQMWLIFGDFPTCRQEMMGQDLYESVRSYLEGDDDDESDELDSDACFDDEDDEDNEEEEIFGADNE